MSRFDYKFSCQYCTELSNILGSSVGCGRHGQHEQDGPFQTRANIQVSRARLEKVRDELKRALRTYEWEEHRRENALRMLEAILEGKDEP